MSNLFEITEDFQKLMDMEIETDDDASAMLSLLEESQSRLEDKVDGIIKVRKMIEGEVAACKVEEERLSKFRSSREKKIGRLMEYLKSNMIRLNISEVKTGTFKVIRVNGKPAVSIDPSAKLPPEFISTKVTEVPDKTKIFDFVSKGGVLDGVKLVQGEQIRVY